MTNQEINESVAKRLGYKPRVVGFVNDPIEGDPGQRVALYQDIPDYCGRIEAAFECLQYREWTLERFLFFPANQKALWRYECLIKTGYERNVFALADTAPMAICLAFLKLDNTNK